VGRLLRCPDAMTLPDYIAFGVLLVLIILAVATHYLG
jgi:hypothetical protein